MAVKRSQWVWLVISAAVLVAAGIGGWQFGRVTPAPAAAAPVTTAGTSSTTSVSSTTTSAPSTTTTAVPTTSTPSTVLGKIDFTSELISAYGDNLHNLESNGGMSNLPTDKTKLESITGIPWSTDMVVALGASYCNAWPTEPSADDGTVSEEGKRQWAEAMAPVLGAPFEATLKAIQSDIPLAYQTVCD